MPGIITNLDLDDRGRFTAPDGDTRWRVERDYPWDRPLIDSWSLVRLDTDGRDTAEWYTCRPWAEIEEVVSRQDSPGPEGGAR